MRRRKDCATALPSARVAAGYQGASTQAHAAGAGAARRGGGRTLAGGSRRQGHHERLFGRQGQALLAVLRTQNSPTTALSPCDEQGQHRLWCAGARAAGSPLPGWRAAPATSAERWRRGRARGARGARTRPAPPSRCSGPTTGRETAARAARGDEHTHAASASAVPTHTPARHNHGWPRTGGGRAAAISGPAAPLTAPTSLITTTPRGSSCRNAASRACSAPRSPPPPSSPAASASVASAGAAPARSSPP